MNLRDATVGSHDIRPPDQLTDKESLIDEWERIIQEVNYWPVFSIARDILKPVRLDTANAIMKRLRQTSTKLVDVGTTSMHDLSGRMLQQLITDRKFLATFYTLPASAALLAELAVSRLGCDWREPASYHELRIADLSCGTGTLISAAYNSILSRCRRAGNNDIEFHRSMIENSIIAADIMPVATHLAASQLSSAHPAITFGRCQVFTMPYGKVLDKSGGERIAIGSLDFLDSGLMPTLFATGERQVSGTRDAVDLHNMVLPDRSIDVTIMNPPFTRPTNHEVSDVPIPSFAGFRTSEQEQKRMSQKLEEYIGKIKRTKSISGINPIVAGHGNAGLASNFFDLAHAKLKNDGILALVLPFSFVAGVSWQNTRTLLSTYYRDIMIVSIVPRGSYDRAFSADTGMAEVLIVATRHSVEAKPSNVMYVNLEGRPKTLVEAIETVRQIRKAEYDVKELVSRPANTL